MTIERIRPIALGIFRRGGASRQDQILVFESNEPDSKGRTFYRPLGGTIEFGEYGHQALIREMREELGAEIENPRYLGLCENLFPAPGGRRGHEIVLLYEADLADKTLYAQDEMLSHEDDGSTFRVLWKSLAGFARGEAPLYPNGLLALLLDDSAPHHPAPPPETR